MNPKDADKAAESLMNTAKPTNTAIKAALAQHQKEQEEQASKRIIKELGKIEEEKQKHVNVLKTVRKIETAAKANLTKVVVAEAKYMEDADFEAFQSTIASLDYIRTN